LLLFTVLSTLFFVLTIPYVYFGWKVLLIHFIMYLWNVGVNTLVVLYFANQNYKRIDLSKGSSFNWEGTGATQFLVAIPLLLTPFVVYTPFHVMGYENLGLTILAACGIAAILTRAFWVRKLVTIFNRKRYKIAEGFRIL